MRKNIMPMNLQFFAEPAEPAGTEPAGGQEPDNGGQQGGQEPTFDYEKLAQLVVGKQNVAEDSVLKGYFKQQGLSKEEMDQAISAFKQQKKQNEPDVNALQNSITEAQQQVLTAQIENKALLMHQELGIDLNTVPYIMKLADLTTVVADGKIDDEKLKEALNKVLEDVPQLKSGQEQNRQGFRQVGAGQASGQGNPSDTPKPVATKRWNRFN